MKHFIKYIFVAVFAIVVGIGAGFAYQKYEANRVEEKFYWGQWDQTDAVDISPYAFVKESTIHDFGAVVKDTPYAYDFLIENQGVAALELWMETQPEGPFSVDLGMEKQNVRPKLTFPITVTLDANQVTSDFEGKFTINTNDNNEGRSKIEFTIKASPAK